MHYAWKYCLKPSYRCEALHHLDSAGEALWRHSAQLSQEPNLESCREPIDLNVTCKSDAKLPPGMHGTDYCGKEQCNNANVMYVTQNLGLQYC